MNAPGRPLQFTRERGLPPPEQPAEHLVYARLLAAGTHAGLFVLVAAFAADVSGLVAPWLPVERLVELWHEPASRYVEQSGLATGWGWLARVRHADIAGLAGIAMLCACSLPGLLALVGPYWRRGDRALAALCAAEVVVVAAAASGLLG